jgi:ParB-like chromosome segregation protein Spo0J
VYTAYFDWHRCYVFIDPEDEAAPPAKVSALIKKHGPVVPLIVDPNGEVIDGFLRLQCLKDQGYKTVPTVT